MPPTTPDAVLRALRDGLVLFPNETNEARAARYDMAVRTVQRFAQRDPIVRPDVPFRTRAEIHAEMAAENRALAAGVPPRNAALFHAVADVFEGCSAAFIDLFPSIAAGAKQEEKRPWKS
jgi:hypothetical protein